MSASVPSLVIQPCHDQLQAGFLALLPRIRLHAHIYFRHLKCPHQHEEAVAEAVALSWLWYCRLARRGKDAARFPSALASFAARAVQSGRRLCGQEKAKDVLSPIARRRHGVVVVRLPEGSAWEEALRHNTRSPVPEQVCFRCDFPAWRRRQSRRDRRLLDDLMAGTSTLEAARRHRLSPARVSQLRREFYADWERFCAAPEDTPAIAAPA